LQEFSSKKQELFFAFLAEISRFLHTYMRYLHYLIILVQVKNGFFVSEKQPN